MPLEVGQVVECVVVARYAGIPAHNVLHYRVVSVSDPGISYTAAADGFSLRWSQTILPNVCDSVAVLSYGVAHVTGVSSLVSPFGRFTYGERALIPAPAFASQGAVAGAGLPSAITVSLAKHTVGSAGTVYVDGPQFPAPGNMEKIFGGRVAVAGVPEAHTVSEGNLLLAAVRAQWVLDAQTLVGFAVADGASVATMQMVTTSQVLRKVRRRRQAAPTLIYAYQDVQSLIPQRSVGTQNTRKPRSLE